MSDAPDQKSQDRQPGDDEAAELLSQPSYDELREKLVSAEDKVNDYWERLLRVQADQDNASRRAERDLEKAHKYALEKFAGALLPIIDSLELSRTKIPAKMQAAAQPVIEGVDLTLKMFYGVLEKFGIKQINPINQPFNPEFEQAISMTYDPDAKPGTVISVLQKGYTLNNRLLRPALVVVAKSEE